MKPAALLLTFTLAATTAHTHSAPAFPPFGNAPASEDKAKAYQADMEFKVFSAIERASHSMFPAQLNISRGAIQLGYNRLLLRDDGRPPRYNFPHGANLPFS